MLQQRKLLPLPLRLPGAASRKLLGREPVKKIISQESPGRGKSPAAGYMFNPAWEKQRRRKGFPSCVAASAGALPAVPRSCPSTAGLHEITVDDGTVQETARWRSPLVRSELEATAF